MIGDFFNILFGAGVPYDAEKNEFRVRPEDAARIDMQRDLLEQEERWNRPAVMFNETYNND
jgi:hypothetical protein